jgi:hypothetical protein
MASALMDNIIAAKLLYMLVTPFDKTDAFKLGIIDAKGKLLKHAKDLKTQAEKDAYNYLTRLVFNLKRLINKLPGGESNLKNLVAAYYFVKEKVETKTAFVSEQQFKNLVHRLDKVTLVEEEILIEKVLAMRDEAYEPVYGNGNIHAKKYSAPYGRPDAKGIERIKAAKEREAKQTGIYKKQNPSDRSKTVSNLMKLVKQIGEDAGGVAANATGAAVSTDQPKIGKKDIKKYQKGQAGVIAGMTRRSVPLEIK